MGAPYPDAKLEAAPEQRSCYTRYRLSSNAGIAQIADFYLREASRTGVPLFDDSKAKLTDYRTLLFLDEPKKYMFVILDRKHGHTSVVVSYKTSGGTDCR
jgi:hypothetical protein